MSKEISNKTKKECLNWIEEKLSELNRKKSILKKTCGACQKSLKNNKDVIKEIWILLNREYKLDGEERKFLKNDVKEPSDFIDYFLDERDFYGKVYIVNLMEIYLNNYLYAKEQYENFSLKLSKTINDLKTVKQNIKRMSYFRNLVLKDLK